MLSERGERLLFVIIVFQEIIKVGYVEHIPELPRGMQELQSSAPAGDGRVDGDQLTDARAIHGLHAADIQQHPLVAFLEELVNPAAEVLGFQAQREPAGYFQKGYGARLLYADVEAHIGFTFSHNSQGMQCLGRVLDHIQESFCSVTQVTSCRIDQPDFALDVHLLHPDFH